ncbi:thioredoxin family protein [Modicisalibacter luteus]|uniref:Thioredoxin family protein n=1 Tax=Modicisalibacter luteus TaxID=453962 RepID=A0ABV7M1M3_9GAMM|nr:thioredoxin family protein [Halomonas lutea]GHA94049.1 thiol reductase thioredoxin [Halomonas lutea]
MPMTTAYLEREPARKDIDALEEPVVLEFGSPWCGFSISTQPILAEAMESHPGVKHLKIADGRGRRLGRSFRVKLWPTLVFLNNGQEVTRLVRPSDTHSISQALDRIDG